MMKNHRLLVLALGALAAVPALGQAVTLLKEINNVPLRPLPPYNPMEFSTPTNGLVMFRGSSAAHGGELWITDGTDVNTHMVLDIAPGAASSNPSMIVPSGGLWYFAANDGVNGTELWKSDGTAAGTRMVGLGMSSGALSTTLAELTDNDGMLYFTALLGGSGNGEVWRTDGATFGRMTGQAAGASAKYLTSFNHAVYFQGASTAEGKELWRIDNTDGYQAAPFIVLRPGTTDGAPSDFYVTPGRMYFVADVPTFGREPHYLDTTDHVVLISDIRANNGDSIAEGTANFTRVGSTIFFAATDTTNNGRELWKTQGDVTSTVVAADLTLVNLISSNPENLTAVGNRLYFTADDTLTGRELWRIDLTGGATRVTDINPGAAASNPTGLISFNGQLYFVATNPAQGTELYKTNGTTTTMVRDNIPGANSGSYAGYFFGNWTLANLGTTFLFAGRDSATLPAWELWSSDGTDAGTARLMQDGPTPSHPTGFTLYKNQLYFSALDGDHGYELWTTDGTDAGTRLYNDLAPGTGNGVVAALPDTVGTVFAGRLYFTGRTADSGFEPYSIDGVNPPQLLNDIAPGATDSNARDFVSANSHLFFVADAPDSELYISDGNAANTVRVDLNLGAGSSNPKFMTPLATGIIFAATTDNGGADTELFFSDGTVAGTARLADINPGAASSNPGPFVVIGGTAYFAATVASVGRELWRTDGTAFGTSMVAEAKPGAGDGQVTVLAAMPQNRVLVSGMFLSSGLQPGLYDPAATTPLVKLGDMDISSAVSTNNYATFGAYAYFGATTAATGLELFRTDGTVAGTGLFVDIRKGTAGSGVNSITATPRAVLFRATTFFGDEVFVTTNKAESLQQVDLNKGKQGSTPQYKTAFAALGADTVIFPALTATDDVELYSMKIDNTPPVITAVKSGLQGNDGIFTSTVRVVFEITDPESSAWVVSGCEPFTMVDDGSKTLNCVAESIGGQASTTTVVVKKDTVHPAIHCPTSLEVEATGPEGAVVSMIDPKTGSPLITAPDDANGAVSIETRPALGAVFSLGATEVIGMATDHAGNTATCSFFVQVVDKTKPTLQCPVVAPVTTNRKGGGVVDFVVTATDSVDQQPSISYNPAPPGSVFVTGDTKVTATATDASGNSASCDFTVTVNYEDPIKMDTRPGGVGPCGCDASGTSLFALAIAGLVGLMGRRRRIAPWMATVSMFMLLGCSFDFKVPEWKVKCGPKGECPKTYQCQHANGICVPGTPVEEPTLLASRGLEIRPGAGNPLVGVPLKALNATSTAVISMTATNPLLVPPNIKTSPELNCTVAPRGGDTSWEFQCSMKPGVPTPDGQVAVTVELTDVNHNSNTLSLSPFGSGPPYLVIDNTPPPPPDTQSPNRIVYHRRPWGSLETNAEPTFTVTCVAGAVRDAKFIRVLSKKSEVVRGSVSENGSCSLLTLGAADTLGLEVSAVDEAGNESTRALIRDIEWIATMGTNAANTNSFIAVPASGNTVIRDDGIKARPTDNVGARDGKGFTITGGASWQKRNWLGPTTINPAVAYDTARGRLVRYGGVAVVEILGNVSSPELWEWTGSDWFVVAPDPTQSTGFPRARQLGAMAFDEKNRRTMLFGGSDQSLFFDDTWFWNGNAWLTGASMGPSPRRNAALFYDIPRERFILFGGETASHQALGDTWAYQDEKWTQLDAGSSLDGSAPPPRYYAGVTYDSIASEGVIFGGISALGNPRADTWRFGAKGWYSVAIDAGFAGINRPAVRSRPGLSFDSELGKTLLIGGAGVDGGYLRDMWELVGEKWVPRNPPPTDAGLIAPVFAFQPMKGTHFLMDNSNKAGFEWDDLQWNRTANFETATVLRSAKGRGFLTYVDPLETVSLLVPTPTAILGGASDQILLSLASDGWQDTGIAFPQPLVAAQAIQYSPALNKVMYVGAPTPGLVQLLSGARTPAKTWSFDLSSVDNNWALENADAGAGTYFSLDGRYVGGPTQLAIDGPSISNTLDGVMTAQAQGVQISISPAGALGRPGSTITHRYDGTNWTLGPTIPENLLLPSSLGLPDGRQIVSGTVLACAACDAGTHSSSWVINGTSVTRLPDLEAGGVALVYNAARGRVLAFGGITASYTSSSLLVEFDEPTQTWIPVIFSDPEGDKTIPPRNSPGFAHHKKWGVDIVYGGLVTTTTDALALVNQTALDDTWILHFAEHRPAGMMRVALSAAQMPPGASPTRLRFTSNVQGSGARPDGGQVQGHQQSVWRRGAWRPLSAQESDGGFLQLSDEVVTAAELEQLLKGQSEVTFNLTPLGANGKKAAKLTVDYVEMSLQYRIPAPPSAGDGGTGL